MLNGSSRKRLDWVLLLLSSEFVSVPRDDEKVLRVHANDLSVVSPEWRNRIQEDRERIHAKFPQLLVPVLVSLFQGNDFGKLSVLFSTSPGQTLFRRTSG